MKRLGKCLSEPVQRLTISFTRTQIGRGWFFLCSNQSIIHPKHLNKMSKTLWKVRAIKNHGAVAKGMEVDVLVENRSGKPYLKDIAAALVQKYAIKDISGLGVPESTFDCTKG
jgi:hypothetical protein